MGKPLHGGGHALEDGPVEERVFLCGAMSQIVNGVNYRLTLGTGQGLTLVHFSAQLEPCLSQANTLKKP